jgi:PadR family transcriptional regulator, regulatory protein PadR
MATDGRQYLPGTLEVLVLKTLSWGPMHGYGISGWLVDRTNGALEIEQGSLYPALHRMERRGWISAEWRLTDKNRRGKYYRLTSEGRKQLRLDAKAWSRFATAVAEVLNGREAPAWAAGR